MTKKRLGWGVLALFLVAAMAFPQASGAQLNGTGVYGNVLMRDTTAGAGWSWQSAFTLNTAGAPTQSASTCGTTPTIVGTNSVGSIVLGAGPTLPCQLVFSQNFLTAPKCALNPEVLTTATTTVRATSVLVSGFVITSTAALVATDKVSWICVGV
jgi:hypothetical protein